MTVFAVTAVPRDVGVAGHLGPLRAHRPTTTPIFSVDGRCISSDVVGGSANFQQISQEFPVRLPVFSGYFEFSNLRSDFLPLDAQASRSTSLRRVRSWTGLSGSWPCSRGSTKTGTETAATEGEGGDAENGASLG